MTAHTPIVAGDGDLWSAASREVNAWRGEAIHHFARAELAVSITLEVLASQPESGAAVRLRRPIGQRFDDLADALSGVKDHKAQQAVNALGNFRTYQDLRTLLCHGAGKVALDRNGQWIVILKLVDMRANSATPVSRTFEEREARELLEALSGRSNELASALQSLRDRLKPPRSQGLCQN